MGADEGKLFLNELMFIHEKATQFGNGLTIDGGM